MIWVFIQARTGSTRLPKKVLAPFGDGLLIDAVHFRASLIAPVAWLIPKGDYMLSSALVGRGWVCLEGSEDDVLSRYVDAAQRLRADHVVRVTADCPFLDVEAARWTLQTHLDSGADFTHYVAEGRGVEVFTREALEDSDRLAPRNVRFLREHPDEWILHNRRRYNIQTVKFSVDTEDELELARRRLGYTSNGH